MENQTSNETQNQESPVKIDSWEAAFDLLNKKNEEDSKESANAGEQKSDDSSQGDSGSQQVPNDPNGGDKPEPQAESGGVDSNIGDNVVKDGNAFAGVQGVSEDDIKKYKDDLTDRLRDQATREVAEEFIKRGIRNTRGVLGATLDDPDICKRDSDGVPRFYNPETGREFNGDNPRRQAQEWVDDYNKELARVFNETCQQYEKHLAEESGPALAVVEFAPKYEKLDPIRKGMFDNVIEDYEVKDNEGKVIGYSCDLDKALALVERQITMIQNYAKQQAQDKPSEQQGQTEQKPGPALDMKTSSGAIPSANDAPPQSLAEAMERQQDLLLASLKKQ